MDADKNWEVAICVSSKSLIISRVAAAADNIYKDNSANSTTGAKLSAYLKHGLFFFSSKMLL